MNQELRVLSVRQPWAWAILHAGKDVENRPTRFSYRGPLAIHASLKPAAYWRMPRGVDAPPVEELEYGAILGLVDLVDVVEKSRSKWFQDDNFGLVLRNPRVLDRPLFCKGSLSLWRPSPRHLAILRHYL